MMVDIQTVHQQQKCTKFFSVAHNERRIEELQRIYEQPQIKYLRGLKNCYLEVNRLVRQD